MDKKQSIKFGILIVILIASVIQLTRLDYLFIANYTNKPKINSLEQNIAEVQLNDFESDDKFIILWDSEDDASVTIKQLYENYLGHIKKSYRSYDINKSQNIKYADSTIIVTAEEFGKISNISEIIKMVEEGSSLIISRVPNVDPYFYRIYRELGIKEIGSPLKTRGMSIKKGTLPGSFENEIHISVKDSYSMALRVEDDCNVVIASDDKIPIMWTKPLGKGRILVVNSMMVSEKENCGILAQSLALSKDDFIYPIFNSKVMYLDDFPAPIPLGDDEDIKRLFRKSIRGFYLEVWWPDMLKISKKFDLKYTSVMIENYNDRVKAPFASAGELDDGDLIMLGREIIKNGGELGLHGYNHQSLTSDVEVSDNLGYNHWESKDDMISSLLEVKSKLDRTFPQYTINTYVPPSNTMSEEGLSALKEAFPDLGIVASLYSGHEDSGSYIQDFELDSDGVLSLPRFSAGYHPDDITMWNIYNGLWGYGMFSHFIHPDDFLDVKRSKGILWPELIKEFENMVSDINERYPWIDSQTSSEAARSVLKVLALDYRTDYADDGISVMTNSSQFPTYFYLKTPRQIKYTEGCEINKIAEEYYLVTVEKNDFIIKYKGD